MTIANTEHSRITIEGIDEPTISRYFETLNAGEFGQTAGLFAESGTLIAPFEEGVTGREAIEAYLSEEAKGLIAFPRQGTREVFEDGSLQIVVVGKVQTPLFTVNVEWTFRLTPAGQIESVTVKLLANPRELLNLRQFA
ncbi:ketosteroid isomerase family protein [Pannus brasiliensis CCIBt3594]|uniref:Ketosteroid isomerase family protein n=1 Tax=Pannus brasiliensis CCIBt3594 TaxID=1427578 RepID=A0AAW9QSH5_9CHRO